MGQRLYIYIIFIFIYIPNHLLSLDRCTLPPVDGAEGKQQAADGTLMLAAPPPSQAWRDHFRRVLPESPDRARVEQKGAQMKDAKYVPCSPA